MEQSGSGNGAGTTFSPTVMEPTSHENIPVSDALLYVLALHLGKSWKELGKHLGISEVDLKNIDTCMKNQHVKEKVMAMFDEWMRIKGDEATARLLQEAMEKTGRSDLSEKVKATMMEPTSLENRPIPYKLFDELAMDLDTSWKILARHLGIPETDITSMDNESGLVDVTYIIMLKEWKRIRGDEATVGILQEALEKTGRSDLSEKVEEYIRDRPEQMKTELEKETKMMQKMSLDRADNKNEDKMKRKIHHPSLKVAVPPNSPPLVLPSPLLDAPGATVPGPGVAPQHQAPIPKVAPAAAPGPSGTVAGGTAVTSPVVSEGDCRSLIGQMVVGQDVPKLVAPRKQAPSLEAPGPHLPGHDHVPKYNITIGAAGNTVIGHNNTATFRTASTDANTVIGANNTAKFKNAPTDAPLTPASPPEPSGAAGPVPLNQASSPSEEASAALPAGRAVPRYNIKIEGAGNTVVGDYNTATFETASTNAPLTPASPPEPSGAAGPAPLTPASPPEPSGAAGPVSMYNITIGGVHNAVIGNSNTATFGTASTNGLHKV